MKLALLLLAACASEPLTPQRIQQGIGRTMVDCLNTLWAQESNSAALGCTCEAKRECLAAGLPPGCAFDDLALETHGDLPPVVGRCE